MVQNEFYPKKAYINAITTAQNAVATFTEDHDFTVGEIVSFRVGSQFGMFQINNKYGVVIATTSDTITVDIDTSTWDAFDYSALNDPGTSPPIAIPGGSTKIPHSNPPEVNLLDAFDNRRS